MATPRDDTAGCSAADPSAVAELAACREALGEHTQVQLVVSATTKDEDLAWQLERFQPLQPDGLVVTKLDESRSLGNVVNLLLAADAPPLSWIADGQRVPEDIHIASAKNLIGQALELSDSNEISPDEDCLAMAFGGMGEHAHV